MNTKTVHNTISKTVTAAAAIAVLIYGGVKLAEKINELRVYDNTARSAEAYFCEKYGYETAEAELVTDHYNIIHRNEYQVFLDITAGDESSRVIAFSNEGGMYFADKFQNEQIIEAVSDEISESISGARAVSMSIFAFQSIQTGDYWEGYFEEYYNGNNLENMLEGSFGYIEIVLADSDIDAPEVKESLDRLTEKWGFEVRKLKITYFDTEENMEKFIEQADSLGRMDGLYGTYSEHIINDFEFSDNS